MRPARDDATEAQVRAARPTASTWLSANAGSGKTRVLTDRVARLLLGGTLPQRILCLTYTKAAAAEMQNRLFERLGEWAMLDDQALREALYALGHDGEVSSATLRAARTLFARAIETPGGLKIQTIHAFCASLLRRFPLEAGVSPQFSEIEDRAAVRLRAQIIEDFATGPQARLLDALARHLSGDDFERVCAAVARQSEAFAQSNPERIRKALGLTMTQSIAGLVDEVLGVPGTADLLGALCTALAQGSTNDQKMGAKLRTISALDATALPILESALLNQSGAKAGAPSTRAPTKATRSALGPLAGALDALAARVASARPLRLALIAAEKAEALHAFAEPFLAEYAARKQLRGWLDFDDLILRARALLNDPAVAAWVLYRLDGGIDHILVDEAQDTSPAQWDVIEKLAQEFTSGMGARADAPRTIFVVGDKKQSIYSFHGADAREFDRMHAEFGTRMRAAGEGLMSLSLEYSFRSAEPILRLVDLVFAGQAASGFPAEGQHRAFKEDMPGRVDLWPLVAPVAAPQDGPWHDPVDRRSPAHHSNLLAEQIAAQIAGMLSAGTSIPSGKGGEMRPLRAGDILILVQRRSDLFDEIIRACKAAGLPIAGADRLKVGAELAVRDLASLLRFLATPEDDLSLATALRSPLLGWSEQALYALAQPRGKRYLWQALRDAAPPQAKTLAMLNDLRDQTDFLRPYELIERILTAHDGRRRLLGRLGAEAEDGIDALLTQALAYEQTEVPSLTGFLGWIDEGELTIKRQLGNAGDMIRVMTVHGAKGLEAPLVILPDTAQRRAPPADMIADCGGVPLWSLAEAQLPPAMAEAREAQKQRQAQERQRLLYVALTRAEKWLIVAAAGTLDEKNGDTWYQQVEGGLRAAGAVEHEFHSGKGLRYAHLDWASASGDAPTRSEVATAPLPAFFGQACAHPERAAETLSPSALGGAKALPSEEGLLGDDATLRGAQIHSLLETLPQIARADWAPRAAQLLGLSDADTAPLLSEAARAIDAHPALFDAKALAEVAVSAALGAQRIHGVIDRLLISDTRILAIDFKTNAAVPVGPEECPEGILRQMGAYAEALGQIYPGKAIETAILWTRTAALMPLPPTVVRQAVWRAPLLDAAQKGS